MNKKNNLILLIASIISTLISLVLLIVSISVYKDEYGTDISINEDFLILLILMGATTIYSLYKYNDKTDQKISGIYKIIMVGLPSFYFLGKFFKDLFKALVKHKEFVFKAYELRFFIGVILLLFLIYFIIELVKNKQAKKED